MPSFKVKEEVRLPDKRFRVRFPGRVKNDGAFFSRFIEKNSVVARSLELWPVYGNKTYNKNAYFRLATTEAVLVSNRIVLHKSGPPSVTESLDGHTDAELVRQTTTPLACLIERGTASSSPLRLLVKWLERSEGMSRNLSKSIHPIEETLRLMSM
uniref:SFRICE_011052 n=1 Tax=Spodoptera frugiperda TaxID=7108 RepID=A0A2H1V6U4_SPOFR